MICYVELENGRGEESARNGDVGRVVWGMRNGCDGGGCAGMGVEGVGGAGGERGE